MQFKDHFSMHAAYDCERTRDLLTEMRSVMRLPNRGGPLANAIDEHIGDMDRLAKQLREFEKFCEPKA